MSDFSTTSGDVRITVKGLSRTVRAVEKAGVGVDDLKDVMQGIGNIVVRAAKVPERTGTLAQTLRAGRGKTKAVVRMGSRRVPYAGVRNFGWPARNIAPMSPTLGETVQSERPQILTALDQGIHDLLEKNDLL